MDVLKNCKIAVTSPHVVKLLPNEVSGRLSDPLLITDYKYYVNRLYVYIS